MGDDPRRPDLDDMVAFAEVPQRPRHDPDRTVMAPGGRKAVRELPGLAGVELVAALHDPAVADHEVEALGSTDQLDGGGGELRSRLPGPPAVPRAVGQL